MSFKHSSFFFDYSSYKDELQNLISEIDRGNTERLLRLVQNIRDVIEDSDRWILYNKGTSLGNVGFDQKSEYGNALIGHWLLLILSKYLRPAESLEYSWNRLFLLLSALEWKEEDAREVIFGNPVAQLIYSENNGSIQRSLKWSDPYWMWIRPERSIYSGWLSHEKCVSLRERLISIRRELLNNIKTLPEGLIKLQFTRDEIEKLLSIQISNYDKAGNLHVGLYSIGYEED